VTKITQFIEGSNKTVNLVPMMSRGTDYNSLMENESKMIE
jgi:hypothetical protein